MQMTRDDHLSSRSESGSKQKGREAARKRAFSPIEQGTTTPTTAKKKHEELGKRGSRRSFFFALFFGSPSLSLSLLAGGGDSIDTRLSLLVLSFQCSFDILDR